MDRAEVFLTTKVWSSDFTRDKLLPAARESLRKLGTDYVDLLLMHWPSRSVPLEETLGAMAELREEGSVRHIGVSNFPPPMVEEAAGITDIFCNQVEYHPYKSQTNCGIRPRRWITCLPLTVRSPRGPSPTTRRWRKLGASRGKSPAQVALRWLVQQEKVAAIPKATSEEHLRANLEVLDFELSEEEMGKIFTLRR